MRRIASITLKGWESEVCSAEISFQVLYSVCKYNYTRRFKENFSQGTSLAHEPAERRW